MVSFRRICGTWQLIVILAYLLEPAGASPQKLSTARSAPKPIPAASPAASQSPATDESVPPSTTPPPAPPPPDPLGRSTPYGCAIGFLQAVNNDNLSVATQYLDTKLPEEKAKELAKELKAVLDASPSSSIRKLSKDEEGDIRDGLRQNREKIGVAKTQNGELDILLDRVQRNQQPPIWLFASETLARIPEAYAHLNPFDLSHYFPESLRQIQLFGLPLWRIITIVFGVLLALVLSSLVTRILLWIFQIFLNKQKIENKEEVLRKLKAPVRILLLSLALMGAEAVSLSALARHYWGLSADVLSVIGFGWLLVSIVDLAAMAGRRRSIATGVQQKIAVITLIQRLTKIFVAFAVLLIFLRQAGINVSAMLAGLGIGGIALALAAQNTLQDLFGGISIIMRDTIRIGDFCRIADQTGVIEDIGLSSTRLRTMDRTIVSIPNSKIAQMSAENFTLRDKFWFHHLLTLRHDTSQAQLNRILEDIKTLLVEDPKIEPNNIRVNLIGFQEARFQIELFAYVKTDTYPNFLEYQQVLLLKVFAAISEAGGQLAMMSQTTYLETVKLINQMVQRKTKHHHMIDIQRAGNPRHAGDEPPDWGPSAK